MACAFALLAVAFPAGASAHLPDLVADPPTNPFVDHEFWDGVNHRIIRFDGYVHNLGPGPLEIEGTDNTDGIMETVTQHLFDEPMADPEPDAELLYETNDGHNHWHLRHAARYSLWDADGLSEVAPAMKVGFCLVDTEMMRPDAPDAEYASGVCGSGDDEATSVKMGLTPGWRDIYWRGLAFQWIDISEVPPGDYLVRGDVDPDNLVTETDEINVGADTPFRLRGYTPDPQVVEVDGPTSLKLRFQAFGDDLDSPEFRIEDPPAHGTLDRPTGEWFEGATLGYTPGPGGAADDSFTFSVRENGSDFPKSPPRATVMLDPAAPRAESIAISGAPEEMVAGTSARLAATLVDSASDTVRWSATNGSIDASGLFLAPASPGTAVVRATAAGGAFDEKAIRIVAAPLRPPLPSACERLHGVVVDEAIIGRICARRANGRLIVSSVPASSGRLRVSVVRRGKIVRRCLWNVRARRRYGCHFKVRSAAGQYVRVSLRRRDGVLISRRLSVR